MKPISLNTFCGNPDYILAKSITKKLLSYIEVPPNMETIHSSPSFKMHFTSEKISGSSIRKRVSTSNPRVFTKKLFPSLSCKAKDIYREVHSKKRNGNEKLANNSPHFVPRGYLKTQSFRTNVLNALKFLQKMAWSFFKDVSDRENSISTEISSVRKGSNITNSEDSLTIIRRLRINEEQKLLAQQKHPKKYSINLPNDSTTNEIEKKKRKRKLTEPGGSTFITALEKLALDPLINNP